VIRVTRPTHRASTARCAHRDSDPIAESHGFHATADGDDLTRPFVPEDRLGKHVGGGVRVDISTADTAVPDPDDDLTFGWLPHRRVIDLELAWRRDDRRTCGRAHVLLLFPDVYPRTRTPTRSSQRPCHPQRLCATLVLLSAIGVVRFSDVLARLHALAKASTLGVLLILVGAAVNLRDLNGVTSVVLAAVLHVLASPPASNMLSRAASGTGSAGWRRRRARAGRGASRVW
jgi:monovalent cation/proton antiporter MnhG/PhaG subunit